MTSLGCSRLSRSAFFRSLKNCHLRFFPLSLPFCILFVRAHTHWLLHFSCHPYISISFISHFIWLIKINYSYVNRHLDKCDSVRQWYACRIKIFEVCSTAASVSLSHIFPICFIFIYLFFFFRSFSGSISRTIVCFFDFVAVALAVAVEAIVLLSSSY